MGNEPGISSTVQRGLIVSRVVVKSNQAVSDACVSKFTGTFLARRKLIIQQQQEATELPPKSPVDRPALHEMSAAEGTGGE